MSATTTMLAGLFFALFGALDERGQRDAQEILSRICNDPKASSEDAHLFRSLAASVEEQYGDRRSPSVDFIDQLIARLCRADELRAVEAENEPQLSAIVH